MKRNQRVSATGALSWFATPLLQLTAVYVQDKQTGVAEGGRKVGILGSSGRATDPSTRHQPC